LGGGDQDRPRTRVVSRERGRTPERAEIAVEGDHAVAAGRLRPLHKDPFDRIMVAQALVERATLLTADAAVARYGDPVRFVG
jgi:PIN domain nuclease of toxin-antitoxin system